VKNLKTVSPQVYPGGYLARRFTPGSSFLSFPRRRESRYLSAIRVVDLSAFGGFSPAFYAGLFCFGVCGAVSVCESCRPLMLLDSWSQTSPVRPAHTIAFVHNTGSAPATVPAASSLPGRSGCASDKRNWLFYLPFVRQALMNGYIFPLCPLRAPLAPPSSPQVHPASSASPQNSFSPNYVLYGFRITLSSLAAFHAV